MGHVVRLAPPPGGKVPKTPFCHGVAFDATGVHSGPGTTVAECSEPPRVMLYMAFPGTTIRREGGAPVFATAEGLRGEEGQDYHLAYDRAGRYKLGRYPPARLARDRATRAAGMEEAWKRRRRR